MLTKRTIFYPLVFLLIMYIFSCVDEPDYINTKRSDLPAPAIKYVEQQDAFSLLIKWYVLNQDDHLVDHLDDAILLSEPWTFWSFDEEK